MLKKAFSSLSNKDDFVEDVTIKVEETENFIRKRQFDPAQCDKNTFRTFTIGKGKKAVGCKVNGKFKVQTILEPKGDFEYLGNLIEDFKLNLNPAEVRLILELLEDVSEEDPFFREVASRIGTKIENQATGKFEEVEIAAMQVRMKGKGRGWHGEPERHSKAAKKGKKDLAEDIEFQGKEGRWVTIRGKHIFIAKGQSVRFTKEGRFQVLGKEEAKKKRERLSEKQLVRERIEKTGVEPERAKREVKEKATPEERERERTKREIEQERRKKEAGFKKGRKVTKEEIMRSERLKAREEEREEKAKPTPKLTFKEKAKRFLEAAGKVGKGQKGATKTFLGQRKNLKQAEKRLKEAKTPAQKRLAQQAIEKIKKKIRGKKDFEYLGNLIEDTEEGRWVTIRGTHVLIKKGESVEQALERTIGKKVKSKKEKFEKKQAKRAKEHKKEVAEIDKIEEIGLKKQKLKRELLSVERGSMGEKRIIKKIKMLRFEKIQAQRAMAHRKEVREIDKREKQELKEQKRRREKKENPKKDFEYIGNLIQDLQYKFIFTQIDPITGDIAEDLTYDQTEAAREAKKQKRLTRKAAASKRTKEAQFLKKEPKLRITPETAVVQPAQTIKIGEEIFTIPQITGAKAPILPKLFEGVGDRPLTPVSSSIVKNKGVFKNELLLQFHGGQGTYTYEFPDNNAANKAWNDISKASPGRWVWNKLRGHKKGDPLPVKQHNPEKLGTAILTKRKGIIGGKGSSGDQKTPYDIRARSPVGKIPFADKIAKALREVKMGIKKPPISGEPFEIKEISEFQRAKTAQELQQLFRKGLDFEYLGNFFPLQHDFVSLKKFTKVKLTKDFITKDFTVFKGPIVRDGSYDYFDRQTGKKITLYKDWDNIKDTYSKYDYLPLKVADEKAHYGELLGFAYNFTPNEKTHELEADLVFMGDVNQTDKDYHVSPGYHDDIQGDIQYLLDLDHVALSLGKERARACTGMNAQGKSCTTVQIQDQNLMEVV